MNWREEYRNKCVDAAEALKAVRSGDRVWVHSNCATPATLLNALVARAGELRNVEIVHIKTMGDAEYTRPEYAGIFVIGQCSWERTCARQWLRDAPTTRPSSSATLKACFSSGNLPLDRGADPGIATG